MARLHGVSASLSHVGTVRRVNEDACLEVSQCGLWAVADGMGGHTAGDFASQAIVAELSGVGTYRCLSEFVEDVERRLLLVNQRIAQRVAQTPGQPFIGSTVTALLAYNFQSALLWAGDSRIYRLREGELRLLTRDHSEVEELIAQGQLARADPAGQPLANVITRAVGALDAERPVEVRMGELRPGDRYMLCTDGLYRVLSEDEMAEVVAHGSPHQVCEDLVGRALMRACSDNLTALVIEFQAQDL